MVRGERVVQAPSDLGFWQEVEELVLKITITDLANEQRWSLQGRLVGPWAVELKSRWREARDVGDTLRCIVELAEVTSLDRDGEAVLAEIISQGVKFIASAFSNTAPAFSLR